MFENFHFFKKILANCLVYQDSKFSKEIRYFLKLGESHTTTAFAMDAPTVVDITETTALVQWNDHLHDEDYQDEDDHDDHDEHEEHEGSGISSSVVDLDDHDDHLEVINYRLTVK